jgi:proton-dependent oligopeptide transporter, POT family
MPTASVAPAHLPTAEDHAFFGHPRGLATLFFTEMWERFSYYGMRALLILFMVAAPSAGGLGFDTATAGAVYGLYTSTVYLATLPGGWIADRLIGQRRAVLWGGVLIACGHFSMAVPAMAMFYVGLALIVLGTGLLKANISVLVGQLYAPDDHRRDAGFSLYYMGINLGAFFSPLVCGYLGQRVNWHAGFGAAGVGMTLGLVQYVLGDKHLGDAGLRPAEAKSPAAARTLQGRAILWGGIALVAIVAAGIAMFTGALPVSPTMLANGMGYLLLVTVVVFFGWLLFTGDWTTAERHRLIAIAALFVAAALFWSLFEQAGSTLNLFADRDTNNSLLGWTFPSSWYQSANALFIIAFAPVFAWLWLKLGRREPSSPVKFSFGLLGAGGGFAIMMVAAALAVTGVHVSPNWLIATYLVHTFAELCLSPVGLSAMTKLAPARVAGLMMGVWFLATSVGDFIAGRLASFYETFPLTRLFGAVAAFGISAGVVMLIASPWIKRMMGEVN